MFHVSLESLGQGLACFIHLLAHSSSVLYGMGLQILSLLGETYHFSLGYSVVVCLEHLLEY